MRFLLELATTDEAATVKLLRRLGRAYGIKATKVEQVRSDGDVDLG